MAKLSKLTRENLRTQPCVICCAPPRNNTWKFDERNKYQEKVRPLLEPLLMAITAISNEDWAQTARTLLDQPLCSDCEVPLSRALEAQRDAQLLAKQAIDIDPKNEDARNLAAQLGKPEGNIPLELSHSAYDGNPVEPSISQVELDRQEDVRTGFVMERELDESSFSDFVEGFDQIRESEHFAPAFRGTSCVGVWIAWHGGMAEEWRTVVTLTPATLVYIVETLVNDGTVTTIPNYLDNLLRRDYKVRLITCNGLRGSLIDFDDVANRELPLVVEGDEYYF